MYKAIVLVLAFGAAATLAQERTTPVPILRQINTHNDDGSYSYGYEAADGSYKIETKAANGDVRGKYGYVDTNGEKREIEYGANNRGFHPQGAGIQVPEVPTSNNGVSNANDDGDDGQCRGSCLGRDEATQNQIQAVPVQSGRPQGVRNFNFNNIQQVAPAQQQQIQQQYYQPQQQQQPAYQQLNLPASTFANHPARNFNLNTGSYTLQY